MVDMTMLNGLFSGAIMNTLAADFVSSLIAVLVFVLITLIGYLVAKILGSVWKFASEKLRIEKLMKEHGLHDALLGWTITGVVKFIVELWVFLIFLGWAAQTAQFDFLTTNIQNIINYIPSLIQGVAVVVGALLVGDYITNTIKESKVPLAKPMGVVIEVAIVYIGVVIALPMILPSAKILLLESTFMSAVNALFITVAIAIGLGGAIALGLGTKDIIRDIARKKQKEIEKVI